MTRLLGRLERRVEALVRPTRDETKNIEHEEPMKIPIEYQPEYVVAEVEITPEEIAWALVESLKRDPDSPGAFARALTNYHAFLAATPDSVIELLGSAARKITAETLRKQASRFEHGAA